MKVTDEAAREWASQLSDKDKEELRRHALLKRAIDLSQPEPPVDWSNLTEAQFIEEKRKLGIG